MSNSTPRVAILLLNWNGWYDTIECLASLDQLQYPCFNIVLCDNGSTDDSLLKIKTWVSNHSSSRFSTTRVMTRDEAESIQEKVEERFIIIENGENLGFAKGNNVGLRFIIRQDYPLVWILNTDTIVHDKALNELVDEMERHKKLGMCGSSILFFDNPEVIQTLGGGVINKLTGTPSHIESYKRFNIKTNYKHVVGLMQYVMGASLLISRECLTTIGVLEERFFLYYEEIDLALRAKDKFKLGYAKESLVYHKAGRSVGNTVSEISPTSIFYMTQSRIKMMSKHFPYSLPIVLIYLLSSMAFQFLKGKTARAIAIWKGIRSAL